MPRYVLIRELWSLREAFIILEAESGRESFRVRGKALSVGDKLSLEDPGGNELAFIRQGLHLGVQGLCYEISQGGQLAARVNLSTRLRPHLLIETPDPGSFAANGDILGMDYEISRDGQQAANVSTRGTPDGRFYSVDVAGQDPVFILALAITIETIHQEQDG
jgi:uncharacterized protein YxjI